MELQEMYDELAQLVAEMRQYLDEHEDEDETLSVEESAVYDAMERRACNLRTKIYEKRWEGLDAELRTPQGKPILNNPGEGIQNYRQRGAVRGVVGSAYHKNFLNAIRTNFKDAKNYLHTGELDAGGFLLPSEMHSEIISALEGENVLRQISKIVTTASEHKVTFVSQKPTATWISEGEEIQFTDTQFGRVSLNAYKLVANLKITNELLQDAYYPLEQFIEDEFGKSLGRAEEEAFLTGAPDVSGEQKQPIGLLTVLNQSATGTLQTVGSEISADDVLTLIYSLDRPYRKSAVFLASDAVIMGLRKLKDSTGNFVWQPSLQEGEPPKLFGVPIYSSNFMPAPTKGNVALVFGDFKNYFIIGERGDRTFRPLRELYALSDQTAFIMIERVDAVVADTRAFRGLKIRG